MSQTQNQQIHKSTHNQQTHKSKTHNQQTYKMNDWIKKKKKTTKRKSKMKTNTNQIQDLTKWVDPKATAERGRESEQERDKG